MAISEAHKKGNRKWDAANMKIVACKIKKEEAERFKQYAQDHNTTPNALLREYVRKCINE